MTERQPPRDRTPRPLIVTDCDEVLLHMVVPFRDWLDEAHDIDFRMRGASFAGALHRRKCGSQVEREEVWPLLDEFFNHQMHRQYAAPGAFAALARIEGGVMTIAAQLLSNDGVEAVSGKREAAVDDGEAGAMALAGELLGQAGAALRGLFAG